MKKENLNVNTSNCHSGLDPESHEMLNQVQHDRIMEQGRSMGEMLGMLAIMGLLSVMAFAGFRIALNKHYANEILNEANKRAVIVAGQIGFNQGTPSLSEFSNNTFTGGTFDSSVTTNPQTESFALKVSNVPEAVCQNILNMIDDHTMLRRLAAADNIVLSVSECTESEGNYLMVYNDDLQGQTSDIGYCDTVADCQTACATCENNVCTNECEIAPNTCTTNNDCTNAGVCAGCVKVEGSETGTCQYACEELEYLESTGSQYIDTDFVSNTIDLKVDAVIAQMASDGQQRAFVGRHGGGFELYTQDNFIAMYITTGSPWKEARLYKALEIDRPYHIIGETSNSSISLSVDDEIVVHSANEDKGRYNILLFAHGTNVAYYAKAKMYYAKLYKNGTLVRDFIPVLDPDGTPAMLDRVAPKLYYNQGTGQFSYGRKQ